jgi:hypothetical protein
MSIQTANTMIAPIAMFCVEVGSALKLQAILDDDDEW